MMAMQPHPRTGMFFTLLMIANGVSSATRSIIPPMLTTLRGVYPALPSDEPLGVLVAIVALLAGLTALPWGILADQHSKRVLLITTTLGWGIVNLITSIPAISYDGFVLYQILNACFIGAIIPVGYAITADIFPRTRHGVYFGWFATGANIGFGLGYVLGGFLPTPEWWNLPFFVAGLIGIILGGIFALTPLPPIRPELIQEQAPLKQVDPSAGQSTSTPDQIAPSLRLSWVEVKNLLANHANIMIFLISFFGVIPNTAFAGWFIRFLGVDHGISEDNGTILMLLVFASQLAGVVLLGGVADKRQSKHARGRLDILLWATVLGTILTIWGIILPFWLVTPDLFAYFADATFTTFFLLLFAGNFFTSVITSLTVVAVVNKTPKHLQASAVAVNNVFSTIGASIALWLCSTLAMALFGGTYTGSFVIINLLYIPCTILALRLMKQE